MQLEGKRALVTGASAGIGTAFARRLAAEGCDLVLTARRESRLRDLAAELEKQGAKSVEWIAADLAEADGAARIHAGLGARGVDVLVNNAGYGIAKDFAEATWSEHASFLQVMVTSVVQLTHLCLPAMLAAGQGQVVQIASLAGLIPGSPTNTLYAASKAFLVRFTESLSAELQDRGVRVTAICPGLTRTEFQAAMQVEDKLRFVPDPFWQTAEEVVDEAFRAMERDQVVRITGGPNRAVAALMRHLPQGVARKLLRPRARDAH